MTDTVAELRARLKATERDRDAALEQLVSVTRERDEALHGRADSDGWADMFREQREVAEAKVAELGERLAVAEARADDLEAALASSSRRNIRAVQLLQRSRCLQCSAPGMCRFAIGDDCRCECHLAARYEALLTAARAVARYRSNDDHWKAVVALRELVEVREGEHE